MSTLPRGTDLDSACYIPGFGLYYSITLWPSDLGVLPVVSREDIDRLSAWSCEQWLSALEVGLLDPHFSFLEALPEGETLYMEVSGRSGSPELAVAIDHPRTGSKDDWVVFFRRGE